MFALIISMLTGYLTGSIPTGFIFAKLVGKSDIRKLGSGNVGATNVYRTTGKTLGVLTLLIDIMKGIIVVAVFTPYFHKWGIPLNLHHHQILMGLAVISGHNWTVFLKFKGGKGIATSAGVLLVLCPGIMGLVLLVWIVTFALTKVISLASIAASISFPIIAAFFGDLSVTLFAVVLCIISIFKHRSNIQRLIRGEEGPLKL